MIRRLWLLAALLFLSLGLLAPSAIAQDATPAAVAPPQDLLPPFTDEVAGQTVEINGANIYYEVYGTGEPLILIHGGLGNGKYWVNQIPVFAAKYQVIVMDSRGHGRSSFDEQPITYALMASDVLGLMDHLAIDKASIVGWSDGGIIGLEIAIHHPERLNKVVAYGANFDPTGVRLDIGDNAYFNAYIERASEDYLTLSPAPERWDEFLNNIGTMWATLPNYTEDELMAITTPFLILDGETEEAIDLNQTKLMALLMPNADLKLMPGTGHFAMFEQPDEFNAIVMDYLAP
ncbi:MAG TPA: alpha/beta hydrolase [Thermomicrobiales bacterium]|jgi:pimeloyl-ACP methyl ester carboxylesterase|nr:alpha/beta hydrolase [Thermomicrobiales bacterium]